MNAVKHGGMRGAKFRAVLEDLGFLVFADNHTRHGFFVRHADGRPLAFYELFHEDLAFRFGWIENEHGNGRTDCISWPELYERITRRKA